MRSNHYTIHTARQIPGERYTNHLPGVCSLQFAHNLYRDSVMIPRVFAYLTNQVAILGTESRQPVDDHHRHIF